MINGGAHEISIWGLNFNVTHLTLLITISAMIDVLSCQPQFGIILENCKLENNLWTNLKPNNAGGGTTSQDDNHPNNKTLQKLQQDLVLQLLLVLFWNCSTWNDSVLLFILGDIKGTIMLTLQLHFTWKTSCKRNILQFPWVCWNVMKFSRNPGSS